jgi:DNA-binding transcriptional LysR family regulator
MPSQIPGDRLAAVRTFVQVVESGSLTEAGRRAGLTPSAVSKQISRLEESLGVRLLERTTRSVRATDAGLELCQRTRPLFEAFAEATAAVRDRSSDVRGRIRLSTTPALARTRVVPALAALAAEHPGLDFELVLTGTRLDFFESELDIAVREGALEDSTLVARSLGTSQVFLCASPAYLERRGRVRSPEDLERHDLLLVPAAESLASNPALRAQGGRRLALKARFRANDLFAVRELAEAGAGIAPLPDYVAAGALAAGTLVRVLPKTAIGAIPIHAVYPSRRHLPRRVSVVLDALGDAFPRG